MPGLAGLCVNKHRDCFGHNYPEISKPEMEAFRKLLVDRFQQHLQMRFEAYCQLNELDANDIGCLLGFIIDQDLIKLSRIKNYTILKEFEQADPILSKHKTRAVHALANRFNISERNVWGALKGAKGGK